MEYDIATKRLLEIGHRTLLRTFLNIEVLKSEFISELPQESVSLRTSDYPILITDTDNNEFILLLEVQTHWKQSKILDMIDYRVRFQKKFQKPVRCSMLLFLKNKKAVNFYQDADLSFRFDLIKLWEMEPTFAFEAKLYDIFPFIPLMKGNL